jgi:hypothetical protein
VTALFDLKVDAAPFVSLKKQSEALNSFASSVSQTHVSLESFQAAWEGAYPGWSLSGDVAYPWQQTAPDGFAWKTRACGVCGGPVVSTQVDPVVVPYTSWSGAQHVSYKEGSVAWTCVAGHKTWAYPALGPVAVKVAPSVSRLRPDGQLELV